MQETAGQTPQECTMHQPKVHPMERARAAGAMEEEGARGSSFGAGGEAEWEQQSSWRGPRRRRRLLVERGGLRGRAGYCPNGGGGSLRGQAGGCAGGSNQEAARVEDVF